MDIQSPFESPITDNLTIENMLSIRNLEKVVKLFCMKVIAHEELMCLIERRFIPQALVIREFTAAPGE